MTDHPIVKPDDARDREAGGVWLRLRDWVRSFRGDRAGGDDTLREDLQELLEEHAAGDEKEAREQRVLLENVLTVGGLRVDDVMVPRADIQAIEETTSLEAAIAAFQAAGHSRLPVYRGNLDDIIGMVHVKDLLRFWGVPNPKFALSRIMRQTGFVPPSMPVLDLLIQMRTSRQHMALVVDEYGGIDGLVTIEDLVEQIVGEIDDEYDVKEGPMIVDGPGDTLDCDARVLIEELEERLGLPLLDPAREEDVDTLGGLAFALVGRVPRRGEVIAHPSGLELEVIDADPRRVKRIRLRNLPALTAGLDTD